MKVYEQPRDPKHHVTYKKSCETGALVYSLYSSCAIKLLINRRVALTIADTVLILSNPLINSQIYEVVNMFYYSQKVLFLFMGAKCKLFILSTSLYWLDELSWPAALQQRDDKRECD